MAPPSRDGSVFLRECLRFFAQSAATSTETDDRIVAEAAATAEKVKAVNSFRVAG
jgi:hypothetical protein